MNKILTLVYPIFNFSETEIRNIVFTSNTLGDEVDILVLIDNPNINEKIINLISENENLRIIPSKKNIGKFAIIKNAVDNNLVKTKWFKVCDPDDLILFENIKKFNRKFRNKSSSFQIRFFPSLIIEPGKWNTEELNEGKYNKLIIKRRILSLVNENTVHPTQDILDFDENFVNQTKSSDVLLSLTSVIRKTKVKNFSHSFYVYNFHNGISSENNVKFNENLFKQFIEFLNIMVRYSKLNKMKAPSFYDYKWAHNYILNSNFSVEKRKEIMTEVFYLLKVAAKDNLNWKTKWNEKELSNLINKLENEEAL